MLSSMVFTTIKQSANNDSAQRYKFSERYPLGGWPHFYDYVCLDGHQPFETLRSLNEHGKEAPECPHCGGKNAEQEAAAFFAVRSSKSQPKQSWFSRAV